MNRNSQLPLIDELPPTVPSPHFPQLFSYPVCRIDSPHDQGCLRNNKAKAAPAAKLEDGDEDKDNIQQQHPQHAHHQQQE